MDNDIVRIPVSWAVGCILLLTKKLAIYNCIDRPSQGVIRTAYVSSSYYPTQPNLMFGCRGRLPALLALNAVTVIWGSQHAIVKALVTSSASDDAPLTLINSIRFTLAAVTTGTLSACRARRRATTRFADEPHASVLRAAAELALWLVAGFTLQLVGLQWTSASRSAFLLYLNAVLVPFIACVLGERNFGLRTWLTAFAAVSGARHAC